MADHKPALYATGVTFLSFICFAVAATAVGLPVWANFQSSSGGYDAERGYFGPWRTCKELSYNREKCGNEVSRFRPSVAVYISGIIATIGCVCLGLFCILSVIQIAMISSRDQVIMKYSVLMILKFILSFLAVVLAIVAAALFAVQTDDSRGGFIITRGLSFYLQIVLIVLVIALFILAIYDLLFSRRSGGDPTKPVDMSPSTATTFNNPGFREGGGTNGTGVSMTDSSGKPYTGIVNGGSVASMNTTLTSVSNGSTLDSVTRSPLRSSLKKPKRPDGLGIQNPGFSGSGQSPTMHRNGSVKKVRIQTHSTEV